MSTPYGAPPASGQQSPNGSGSSNGSGPGHPRSQNIAQLAQAVGQMELCSTADLHDFLEAYRTILNYLAISAHLAKGQLIASARLSARQNKDGRLTAKQWADLYKVMRRVGKDIDQIAVSCVEAAAGAVKGWKRYETFLDDLENSNEGRGQKFGRPGSRTRGFTVS